MVRIPEYELYIDTDTSLTVGLLPHVLGIAHQNVIEIFHATLAFPVVVNNLCPTDLLRPMDTPFDSSFNYSFLVSVLESRNFFVGIF